MHLSNILVTTSQPYFEPIVDALTHIEGLELDFCDREHSQIIVKQEVEDTAHEVEGLQRIQSLPHVDAATMVFHYCDEDFY